MSRLTGALGLSLGVAVMILLAGCTNARPAHVGHRTAPSAVAAEGAHAPQDHSVVVLSSMEADAVEHEPCEPEEEECERNKATLFLGYSFERGEGGPSIGLGYERRLSRRVGVGGFAEHTFGELDTTALGVGAYLHPCEPVVLFAGPGLEIEHDGEEQFLMRVGGAYEVPLRRGFSVAPAFYVDFLEDGEQVFILGVELGKGW